MRFVHPTAKIFAFAFIILIKSALSTLAHAETDAQFEENWNQYVREATGCTAFDAQGNCQYPDFQVQPNCHPMKYEPARPSKGTIILLSGFTNCPQVFYKLGPALQARGYEVLVPLLPGHGRKTIKVLGMMTMDDLRALPVVQKDYDDFAQSMSEMIKNRPGVHMILGHSVGGAVATRAMELFPNLYDRALLISPFYNMAPPLNWIPNLALRLNGDDYMFWSTGLVPDLDYPWNSENLGKKDKMSCFEQIAAGPTHPDEGHVEAYCSYTLNNLAATRDLGTTALAQEDLIRTPFQVVGVSPDVAAYNAPTIGMLRDLSSSSFSTHACFMKGVPHPMLDPFIKNPFWMPSLINNIVNYLDLGIPYPSTTRSPEGGYPYCEL